MTSTTLSLTLCNNWLSQRKANRHEEEEEIELTKAGEERINLIISGDDKLGIIRAPRDLEEGKERYTNETFKLVSVLSL